MPIKNHLFSAYKKLFQTIVDNILITKNLVTENTEDNMKNITTKQADSLNK